MNDAGSPPQASVIRRWIPASWLAAQGRERDLLLVELGKMRGLIPVLMKRRNGQSWSAEERAQLVAQIRSVAHVSPYLVVLVLPGSFLALPALAWWLDRRRRQRGERRSHEAP